MHFLVFTYFQYILLETQGITLESAASWIEYLISIIRCHRNDKGRTNVWNNAYRHERRISKYLGKKPP